MKSLNSPKTAESATHSPWGKVFVGSDGLRVGWRLIVFTGVVAALFVCFSFLARPLARIPPPSDLPPGAITPLGLGGGDVFQFLAVCLATWIMARIERRKFSQYGLPLRAGLGKDLCFGLFLGFFTINVTLLGMFLLHGFRVTGLAIHGTTIVSSLVAWTLTFVMVGLFEEFGFRGYVQYTLASGIGFWPAAFVISGLFGLVHLLTDINENVAGSLAVVMFGLLLCLLLRRTGNLWCAIGFHFAYDWSETFFYGIPDSGFVAYRSLFSSALSGPHWLTGGKVGPEASVLTPIVLLIAAMIFIRFYPENRTQIFPSS